MKSLNFKDWSIFNKIISLVVLTILPFVFIIQFLVLPSVENNLLNNKKTELKHIVETAYNMYKAETSTKNFNDSLTQAQKNNIFKNYSQMRYDRDNYLFVIDLKANMMVHINKSLIGTSVWNMKDTDGKFLFQDMVNIAKSDGDGYVHYTWEKPGSDEPVPKLTYIKLLEDWDLIVGTGIYIDDIDAEMSRLTTSIYTGILLVILAVAIIGLFLARTISSPIKLLDSSAEKVAKGDTQVRVDIFTKDEVGRLANSFNKMIANLDSSFKEVQLKSEAAEKAAQEAQEAKSLAESQKEYLTDSTHKMLIEMNKFSEGDLTTHLIKTKEDDIGKLFSGYNKTVESIRNLIKQITTAVEATASASAEISSSAEELAAGTEEQSTQTSEVAAAVEEMTQTIVQTSRNASNAANSADLTSNKAKEGALKLKENKEGIEKISRSSEKTGGIISSLAGKTDQIGEIAQVIDDIADQTNLLALNAAIEAARAGEQGRGFAVVADEVRKLAERTTKATKEIAETIHAIQIEAQDAKESMDEARQAVSDGLKITKETEEVFRTILDSAENLLQEITQVAAASEEQSSAAEEISKNVEGINSISQQSASSVQLIAQATEDLNHLTENLNLLVNRFNIGDHLTEKNQRISGQSNHNDRFLN